MQLEGMCSFLRTEIGLSQRGLGERLGVTASSTAGQSVNTLPRNRAIMRTFLSLIL